jgi:hypothetical protein
MSEAQGQADSAMPSPLLNPQLGEMQWPNETTKNDIDFKQLLGRGAFGEVHLVSVKNDRLPARPAVMKISNGYE